ncbi:SemiSWEET family sugar transporter [Flavobacterium sp.]|uniref:SemiSWEET family sugar transporter n=1 Tax=Flavobacterium sp. TaxID=239 RepID=UPI0012146B2A|nr:SemiSWEET transporter [Flavobacterium sp.]RZJ70617.1 MAG: glutathione synthetase [Flavobacterium sp.]
MYDFVFWIGIAAALFITVANVPQVVKIVKSGDVKSISVLTYSALVLGNALWLVYGVLKQDVPILVANAISTLLCTAILLLKLFPKLIASVQDKTMKNN